MDFQRFIWYFFAVVGIVICFILALFSLIWSICFIVRVMFKSFGAKVGTMTDIAVEDIKERAELKREVKRRIRAAKKEHKEQSLALKIQSMERINAMKRKKYDKKLQDKEMKYSIKTFGEYVPEQNGRPTTPADEVTPYGESDETVRGDEQETVLQSEDVETTAPVAETVSTETPEQPYDTEDYDAMGEDSDLSQFSRETDSDEGEGNADYFDYLGEREGEPLTGSHEVEGDDSGKSDEVGESDNEAENNSENLEDAINDLNAESDKISGEQDESSADTMQTKRKKRKK